jgi:Uma2 family endonuclease
MSVQRRYTSRDLEDLPHVEGTRYEIINGELHASKALGLEHQHVCMVLGSALHVWCKSVGHGRAYGGPGLVFSEDNDVIPDVIWISLERLRVGRDAPGTSRSDRSWRLRCCHPDRRTSGATGSPSSVCTLAGA